MTKPSDFSPSEALEVKSEDSSTQSRVRWTLRSVGIIILAGGWASVAVTDFGTRMFVLDTVVFLAMAAYAFAAATASRATAVNEERKLRLRLLVHNMELENMSMRDELTQLFNRRYLFDRLERELHTAQGFQRPLAYISIELRALDHFNHTYGYAVGDQILAAFGQFLLDRTRATDIPARASGDKFGIILPDTSKRGAYTMVDRLTTALAEAQLAESTGLDSPIVASFGVSGYPWGSDSVDDLVRQAETEMAAAGEATVSGGGELSDGERDSEEPVDEEIPAVFRQMDGAPKGL